MAGSREANGLFGACAWLTCVCGLVSPPSRASEVAKPWEVTAGTNGLLSFSSASTQISVFAEPRFQLSEAWQLGASAAYRYQSANGASTSAFQGLLGATLNLGDSLNRAFFASFMAGLTTGQTLFGDVLVNSDTEFSVAVSVGKRFALADNLAYTPSVGLLKELNFSPTFTIQPIALSVFF